jgi:hypothetical protein
MVRSPLSEVPPHALRGLALRSVVAYLEGSNSEAGRPGGDNEYGSDRERDPGKWIRRTGCVRGSRARDRQRVARGRGHALDRRKRRGTELRAGPAGSSESQGFGTAFAGRAVKAITVGHDHEQLSAVDEGEFLPEELRVPFWLAPERCDRAEISLGCDQRYADRVAAVSGGRDCRLQLRLLVAGHIGVLRQKQRLGGEHVGRGVTVGPGPRGRPCAEECQHGEQCERLDEPAAAPEAMVCVVGHVDGCLHSCSPP